MSAGRETEGGSWRPPGRHQIPQTARVRFSARAGAPPGRGARRRRRVVPRTTADRTPPAGGTPCACTTGTPRRSTRCPHGFSRYPHEGGRGRGYGLRPRVYGHTRVHTYVSPSRVYGRRVGLPEAEGAFDDTRGEVSAIYFPEFTPSYGGVDCRTCVLYEFSFCSLYVTTDHTEHKTKASYSAL